MVMLFENQDVDTYTFESNGDESKQIYLNNIGVTPSGFVFTVINNNEYLSYLTLTNDVNNRAYQFNNLSVYDNLDNKAGSYGANTGNRILFYNNFNDGAGSNWFMFNDTLSQYSGLELSNSVYIQNNYMYTSYDSCIIRTFDAEYYWNDDNGQWAEIPFYSNTINQEGYYDGPGVNLNGTMRTGNIFEYNVDRLYYINDTSPYNWSFYSGGDYMFTNSPYSGGNIIQTDLSMNNNEDVGIPYTHTQMDVSYSDEAVTNDYSMNAGIVAGSNIDFGDGSNYFTNLYPGLFVLCADYINIGYFQIVGAQNRDQIGAQDNGNFQVTVNSNLYTVYWRRNWNNSTNRPSSNHIIILQGDGSGITQDDSVLASYAETDRITGTITGRLHYLFFAKANSAKVTDLELTNLAIAYLNQVDNNSVSTLNDVIGSLNTNYASITSVFPVNNPTSFDARVITRGNLNTGAIPYYDQIARGPNYLVLSIVDSNRDDQLTIKVYDNQLNISRSIETSLYYNDLEYGIEIVGERITVNGLLKTMINGNFAMEEINIMITPDSDYAISTLPGWGWQNESAYNDGAWSYD